VFPAARGGLIDIDNWHRREWLTPHSLRHTYASFALAEGVSIFVKGAKRTLARTGDRLRRARSAGRQAAEHGYKGQNRIEGQNRTRRAAKFAR
jgi:hypothetical protein